MKTAILFRCHNQNEITMKHLQELIDTGLHVFVAYDSTNREPMPNAFNFTNEDLLNNQYVNATNEQLAKIPSEMLPKSSPNIYFNVEQAVMMWYFSQPEFAKYDYVWSIEYDVRFNGNWQHFFHYMSKDESDFLGTYIIKSPKENFYDGYWQTYQTDITESNKFSSFGCIHRYSRDLIKFADVECRNGFHSYYEQVMPTIASLHNLTIKDINVVAQEQKANQQFYNPISFSGFQLPLEHQATAYEMFNNHLFHPIR